MAAMETRQILRKLLDKADISEWRLAEATGVSQSTINAILKGRSKEQKDSTLEPLAQYFGVSLKQLRGYDEIAGVADGSRPRNEHPILNDDQVLALVESGAMVKESSAGYVSSAYPKGAACFVYRLTDEAMEPVLGKGAMVFVDPDFTYPDDVQVTGMKLALINVKGRLAVRIETDDLGAIVYKPLNAGFRTVADTECDLVGYVVGMPEQDWTKSTGPESG